MDRKVKNSILAAALVVISIIAMAIWSNNSQQVSVSENPLTQGTDISGGGSSYDKGIVKETDYTPTLLSSPKIFDLGMRSSEYHALIRSLDVYTKKKYDKKTHVTYTIDSSSTVFNKDSNTFTFQLEEGKNSGKFLSATVKRPKFNYLEFKLKKDGEIVHEDTIKVNMRL